MSQRLKEIQNLLKTTDENESNLLYKEAFRIFKALGKDDKAQKCLEKISNSNKLEFNKNGSSDTRKQSLRQPQRSQWVNLAVELWLSIIKFGSLSLREVYNLSITCTNLKYSIQANPVYWHAFEWDFKNGSRDITKFMTRVYGFTKGLAKEIKLGNAVGLKATFIKESKVYCWS